MPSISLFRHRVQAANLLSNANSLIEITNLYGRVYVSAEENEEDTRTKAKFPSEPNRKKLLTESDIKYDNSGGNLKIEIAPQSSQTRIDLTIKFQRECVFKIEMTVKFAFREIYETVEVETNTGTISADVPLDDVKYNFVWTESRPRFLSDVESRKNQGKSGGKICR